jgi:membrane fusion protein, multidrug efflux system
MKKIILTIMSLLLIGFLTQCSQSDKAAGGDIKAKKGQSDKADKSGKDSKNGEIDVDKLDIPERMKQAIKSGRIPKERIKMMLERMKGGGNAPTVQVEAVKRQKINAFLVLNGVVEPERKVEVYSRLSAYVKKIVKEEGAEVKKGDVLALLDDTEIRIQHRQSEIQLKQAELTLKDEEINFNRSKELKDTNMISEQEFQLAMASFNKAKLDYQTKSENFKDLELQLSYTKIKSASEGFVTERMIEVGTRVNSNQQVYTVEDFSPLLVKVYVPTVDIVNLKTGMDTEITTDVLKGRVFEGKIKLINPRIDVQSGTVKVTLEVFDKSHRLKPGMFVETKILIKNKPDAVVIPRKSVTYKADEAFVFVFDRKQMAVSKRIIKTGISEGDNIEVEDGLNEGERIVIVGVEGLKDKAKVRIVR